jgi:hypothetical protein
MGDYLEIEKKWPRRVYGLAAFALQNQARTPEKIKNQHLFYALISYCNQYILYLLIEKFVITSPYHEFFVC